MKKIFVSAVLLAVSTVPAAAKELVTVFVHGLGGNANHKEYIKHLTPTFSQLVGRHGPEWATGVFSKKAVCLGQDGDVAVVRQAMLDARGADNDFVLWGISKGAATVANTITALEPELQKMVKAIVLDSPFANANDIAYDIAIKGYHLDVLDFGGSSMSSVRVALPYLFGGYKADGLQPLSSLIAMPDIPVFLVHCKDDELIPVHHSRVLYAALRMQQDSGQRKAPVFLLELEKGGHNGHLDDQTYTAVVQAFYQHIGLPCRTDWANHGNKKLWKECRPSLETVQAGIPQPKESTCSSSSSSLPSWLTSWLPSSSVSQ